MCLLTTSTLTDLKRVFLNTPKLLEDVYDSNEDGLGVMYPSSDGLIVTKILPKNVQEVRQFFESLPDDDRHVACHWRMRTHGNIDMDNCHPYQVYEGTYLAHNGVLQTGNSKDPSKSDTWHYIQDYLSHLPVDTLHHPAFIEILGAAIGGNRFAIMSADGRLSVVNQEQGIEAEGIWFSNTYAWSPGLLIPSYKSRSTLYYPSALSTTTSKSSSISDYTWTRQDYSMNGWEWVGDDDKDEVGGPLDMEALSEMVYESVINHDVESLADLLEDYTDETLGLLLSDYNITEYVIKDGQPLSRRDAMFVHLLVRNEEDKLLSMTTQMSIRNWARQIAECITYYCSMKHLYYGSDPAADNNPIREANAYYVG